MTDNKIIKALECCKSEVSSCEECPMYIEGVICHGYELNEKTLDLITRQQAEIERLQIEIGKKDLEYSGLEHERSLDILEFAEEIERLKDMVSQNEGVLPKYENLIKSEAVKEFYDKFDNELAEIRDRYHDANEVEYGLVCEVIHSRLYKCLKEMVGDNDAE